MSPRQARRVVLAAEARAQLQELRQHYRRLNRPEAVANLAKAVEEAKRLILDRKGLPAPRPYPRLAAPGRAWVHAGSYWIGYRQTDPPAIFAVFYDRANIPGRL